MITSTIKLEILGIFNVEIMLFYFSSLMQTTAMFTMLTSSSYISRLKIKLLLATPWLKQKNSLNKERPMMRKSISLNKDKSTSLPVEKFQ